jgi:hypothetical protein
MGSRSAVIDHRDSHANPFWKSDAFPTNVSPI